MFILKKFQKQNSEGGGGQNGAGPLVNGVGGGSGGHGYQPMGQNLQRKFARGIQYNMKIIIRGDRNVGKTCLYHRLQGGKFHEEYAPSEEIQVASIHWNYNASDDIVKVEIWDVVDKGKKRENLQKASVTASNLTPAAAQKDILKMHNNQSQQLNSVTNGNQQKSTKDKLGDAMEASQTPVLDAEFVDVYKGTNGVIFLFDMTKAWTFEYVEREVRKCPLQIPIMILANHRDMGHHRVITSDQVQGLIDTVLKEDMEFGRNRTGQIRHSESSMRNGFGLRYLYKFFNLPYLHLQRETLMKQLERNRSEIGGTCQELDLLIESDEHNYDLFLEMITNRRRQAADQLSCVPSNGGPPRSISMPANIAANATVANQSQTQHNSNNHQHDSSKSSHNNPAHLINKPTPSIIIGANNPLPTKFQQQLNQQQQQQPSKFPANNPNNSNDSVKQLATNVVSTVQNNAQFDPNNKLSVRPPVKTIDDFIPEDSEHNIFRKFLDEPSVPPEIDGFPSTINEEDSDEDDEGTGNNNPMVARYQEELDPEDLIDENDTTMESSRNTSIQNKKKKKSYNNSLLEDYVNKRNELVKECINEDETFEEESQSVSPQGNTEIQEEKEEELNTADSCANETLQNISSVTNEVNHEQELQNHDQQVKDEEEESAQVEQTNNLTNHQTLNCDEIDALEKLYISSSSNNQTIENQNSKSTKPTNNNNNNNKKNPSKTSGKKLKSNAKTIKQDDNNSSNNSTNKSSMSGGKKSKAKQPKIKIRNVEDYPVDTDERDEDILERERRQLEDFLGGGGASGGPDPNSYQML